MSYRAVKIRIGFVFFSRVANFSRAYYFQVLSTSYVDSLNSVSITSPFSVVFGILG